MGFIYINKGSYVYIKYISIFYISACNSGDTSLIPRLGRPPGEGNGNPLQYSCLENSMERGAWWATVHGVARVGHDLATKEREGWIGCHRILLITMSL